MCNWSRSQEEVEDDALEDAGASPVSAAGFLCSNGSDLLFFVRSLSGPKFGIPKKAYFCVGQRLPECVSSANACMHGPQSVFMKVLRIFAAIEHALDSEPVFKVCTFLG